VRFLVNDESRGIDGKVAQSELKTGDRNAALAHFMAVYGTIKHPVEQVLGTYFQQCAISMNCLQLSQAGMLLVSDGLNKVTGARVVSPSAHDGSTPSC
jgi:glutaminase